MAKTKGKTRKKNTKKPAQSLRQIGLVMVIIALLAGGSFGFLGSVAINIVRLLFGNSVWLGVIGGLLLGGWLVVFNRLFEISTKNLVALGLIGLSWLLLVQLASFPSGAQLAGFWQHYSQDFWANTQSRNVGGGLLAAILANILVFLVAHLGAVMVAIGMLVGGIAMLANVDVFSLLKSVASNIGSWYENVRREKNQAKRTQTDEYSSKKAAANVQEKLADSEELTPQPSQSALEHAVQSWHENTPPEQAKDEPELNFASQTKQLNNNYQLPPVDLLSDVAVSDQSQEAKLIKRNEKVLQATLKSFGVDAKLTNTILGPAVTKYELHPAIGVKVSKIVNLSDDLALALAAKDIRIEAPIPGKSLIGIEVPNQQVATIAFKDVMAHTKFSPNHPLLVPLGRDISGQIITADLAKMPHLLIAGATGSGKSVAINGIITSLLMKNYPSDVKLVLVDPKKVELGIYNDIPHLLTPVVVEANKAARALRQLVAEMERRYELFAKSNQRNIAGYNAFVIKQNKAAQKLPYIVLVVDELADLMMVAQDEVEASIIRLAQMARAAGIHMILATQRPSVNVITGLIKANIPSRMAFAVSSGVDSRTIIDTNGAEKLLGRGDMLFLPMGQSKPTRVQGAFIPDDDVANVVAFIKAQQTAHYDDTINLDEPDENNSAQPNADPLYQQVIDLARHEQKISTSMVQRRFRIGYNRAARLIDEMHAQGIIGPQEGSKPRKVYLPPNEELHD